MGAPRRNAAGAARAVRFALLSLAALTACVFALPSQAHASTTQQSMLMDDDLLLYGGDATADRTLDTLQALGVDRVRVSIVWRYLAPKPSASSAPRPLRYAPSEFDRYDHLVRAADHRGIGVLFNVTGRAPNWATGRRHGRVVAPTYKPSPSRFGAFVRTLATRYDGHHVDENQGGGTLPRVSTWSIWNEPNLTSWLSPQWERHGHRWVNTGARLYRSLARAAIAALRATGHANDTILLGETSPLGSRKPGTNETSKPARFLRDVLCLGPTLNRLGGSAGRALGCDFARKGALNVSGYAHHPYSVISAPATKAKSADDLQLGDLGKLERILDAGAAAGRVHRGLPVWISEYGYQTKPPDPYRGIPLARQVAWLAQAEHIAYADPRVAAFTQFLLRDGAPNTAYPKSDRRYWSRYQSGLEYADGTAKPAYDAYRVTIDAPGRVAPGKPLTVWGCVRGSKQGGAPDVRIEFQPDGSSTWQQLGAVQPGSARRYLQASVTPPGSGIIRLLWKLPQPAPSSLLDQLFPKSPPPPVPSAGVHVQVG